MNISFGSNYSSDLNSLIFSRKGDKEVAIPENIADTRNVYEAAFGGLFDLQENALLTELFGSKTPDGRQLLAARLILDNEMALTKENVTELKSYILQYPDIEPSIPAVMMKNDIPINSYSVAEMQKYISGRIGFESAFLEMEKELEDSGMGEELTGDPTEVLPETDSGVTLGTEYGVGTEAEAVKAGAEAVKAEAEAVKAGAEPVKSGAEAVKVEAEVTKAVANSGNTGVRNDAQSEKAVFHRPEMDGGEPSHTSKAEGIIENSDSRAVVSLEGSKAAKADNGTVVKEENTPVGNTGDSTAVKTENSAVVRPDDKTDKKTGDKWGDKSVIRSEGKLFIRHTDFSRKELERFNGESREFIRRVIAQTENNPSRASLHSKAQAALKAFNAMVDINSVFPHAYIPFRMENKHVNAGLFVYTNKKTKAPDPQNCTALLHLDMPSLGPTDIFLRLNSNRLGTEFKADEEAVKLLKNDFPSLEGRLKKLGFTVEGSFTSLEDKKDAPKDSEHKKNTADASEKDSLNEFKRISDADSFDVRA